MSARTHRPIRRRPAVRAVAAALVVVLSLLSLLSSLAVVGPLPANVAAVACGAACDSGERPAALDRHIEPLRVVAVRAARASEASAPRLRMAPLSRVHALAAAARPTARTRELLAHRRAAIDGDAPRARARAERMVFLI